MACDSWAVADVTVAEVGAGRKARGRRNPGEVRCGPNHEVIRDGGGGVAAGLSPTNLPWLSGVWGELTITDPLN